MTKMLREGFTTGSAVAGAAKAALVSLMSGVTAKEIDIPLPPFENSLPRARLCIPVHAVSLVHGQEQSTYAIASVVKDGGDDPDATTGIMIHVIASFSSLDTVIQDTPVIAKIELDSQGLCAEHQEVLASLGEKKRIKGQFCLQSETLNVAVTTGVGIGVVTLPGLPIPVGEPAVNPEPRKQLYASVREVVPPSIYKVYLYIEAPKGVTRAKNTLNPKLGIKGGISILGTHGIVRPYSHEAFTKSITQGLDVAVALGAKTVFLTTGRRSERLLLARYSHHIPQAGIQIADYAAHAIREATSRDIEHIVWGCFPGKLVKLSQGLEWTHASQGAPDIGILSELWVMVGGLDSLVPDIVAMPTAAGAFALMEASNKEYYKKVLTILGEKALNVLRTWCKDSDVKITLHVFSLESEILLSLSDTKKA